MSKTIRALGAALGVAACAPVTPRETTTPTPQVQKLTRAEMCALIGRAEPVDVGTWPKEWRSVQAVRDDCAGLLQQPGFCPDATAVSVARTADAYPGAVPPDLEQEADKRRAALGADQ